MSEQSKSAMRSSTAGLPPGWFQPGDHVTLVGMETWGTGQVQSVIGKRVTVNFEDGGKQVLNTDFAQLKPAA